MFHRSGRVRGVFRRWVYRSDGSPRRPFAAWLTALARQGSASVAERASTEVVTAAPLDLAAHPEPCLARIGSLVKFSDGGAPAVSFIVASGEDQIALSDTLSSLRAQHQDAWEIVIYGLSPVRRIEPSFAAILQCDPRTVVGANIANLNDAFAIARGKFVAVVSPGDMLATTALDAVTEALTQFPDADIFYSDEDRRSGPDQNCTPYLKPAWSPDLLYSFNYFGRLTLLRRLLVCHVGGFDVTANAATEWDLNLRAADAAQTIIHIPKILCHRAQGSIGDRPLRDTPAAADARKVIELYWRRRGFAATAVTNEQGAQSVVWPIVRSPLVSVIIPTKDKPDILRTATKGLLQDTDFETFELVIVDTGSQEAETQLLYQELQTDPRVKIVNFTRKFNYSAACNYGASCARGDILLFLNNDIEVISPDWLAEMTRYAMRPGVGCVGTKLIFPSHELQHGGVGIGPHLAALIYRSAEGMGLRHFRLPRSSTQLARDHGRLPNGYAGSFRYRWRF